MQFDCPYSFVIIQENTTLHVPLYIFKQTNLPLCVIEYHVMRATGAMVAVPSIFNPSTG